MDVRTLYPSKWLSPDDLGNRRVEVTISECGLDEVYNSQTREKERKLTVSFAGAKKRLICNKTQTFAIAEIAGSYESDDWKGTKVSLRVGNARNGKPTIVVEPAAVQPAAAGMEHEE
ncbi:MAG: hypothetical protein KDE19_15295 [Caldilineaceae bacterium]|nr:hypothetical protein [Caldilineaceae bacterium]